MFAPGGQFAKGSGVGARAAITESLGRSAMVKRGGEMMSVREATIIVALVNHPALIDENFAHVEFLDLANTDLQPQLAALSRSYDADRTIKAYTVVDQALAALERNASPKVVVDWVVLQI